jgi:hypothetical protein
MALGASQSLGPSHGSPDWDPPMPNLLATTLFFGPPVFGALGGFISRRSGSGRDQPAIASSQYSKWWWLGYFGVQTWTAEERKVRIALSMAAFVITIVGLFVVGAFLE